MTAQTRYVAQPDVIDCDIGGERALLHLKTNTYFTLNATGSEIWPAFTEPCSVDEIVTLVTERFDVTPEVCRPDIEALIEQMVAAQILRVQPAD